MIRPVVGGGACPYGPPSYATVKGLV